MHWREKGYYNGAIARLPTSKQNRHLTMPNKDRPPPPNHEGRREDVPDCYSAIFGFSNTLLKANLNVDEISDSGQGVIKVAYLLDNAPKVSHNCLY